MSLRNWLADEPWRAAGAFMSGLGIFVAAVCTPISVAEGYAWWWPWVYLVGIAAGVVVLLVVLIGFLTWLDGGDE